MIEEIDDDLGERNLKIKLHAVRGGIFLLLEDAAPLGDQVHDGAVVIGGRDDLDVHPRLADLGDGARVGQFGGRVDRDDLTGQRGHFVLHRGRGEEHIQQVLAFNALLDDLHVEESQKARAEAESERLRRLRLEGERGVVELQFFERLAQVGVIVRFDGVDARKDHRLGMAVARQRFGGRIGGAGDGVAHAAFVHGLETRGDVTDLARPQTLDGLHARREDADLHGAHIDLGGEHAQHVRGLERAFDHAHVRDDALVGVVMRVEDQRAQGDAVRVFGRRHTLDDGLQHLVHVQAVLGRDADDALGGHADQAGDVFGHFVGTGRGQVDLVDHGDNFQVRFESLVEVGQRLGLDALGRVHYQHGPFTSLERAADLVAEVNVPGRVDQVDLVLVRVFGGVIHAHRRGLDGDALFAFEVHRVEHLRGHIPLGDGARQLQEAVGERGFAMIYMGDDTEVTDMVGHISCGREYNRF